MCVASMATFFPPFSPINISVSITNNKKDYISHLFRRKHLSRNISQHIATGDSPVRNKDYFLLFVLTFYIS